MLTLDDLILGIPDCWDEATRGNERAVGNHPAAGQGTVTALLVQKWAGGKIVRCEVGAGSYGIIHYFNELDNRQKIDIAGGQFRPTSPYRKMKRNPPESLYIFNDTWHRVNLLESRVFRWAAMKRMEMRAG